MMHSMIILYLFIFIISNSCNVYCITMKIDTNKIYSKTWSNRQGLVLTPINKGIWAAERPFIWNNIDVGGRSVIARMTDGSLLVHSPVEWTGDLGNILKSLGGEVEHIVSPNYEHVKYALQWSTIYPNATLYGCPGLSTIESNTPYTKELPYDVYNHKDDNIIDNNTINSSLDMIHFNCEINPFTNKPFFNEVVFYHKKSKTLFMSDVYWNYPCNELPNYKNEMILEGTYLQHICSKVPIITTTNNNNDSNNDIYPKVKVPIGTKLWKFGMDKIYKSFYQNYMIGRRSVDNTRRNDYNRIINHLLSLDIDVIVPCHGDIIRGTNICNHVLKSFFL